MKKTIFCCILFIASSCLYAQQKPSDRKYWLSCLDKLARPVLSNLAADNLKAAMPVTLSERIDNREQRSRVAYLEAFGRLMSGIAPWLNAEGGDAAEQAMRKQYREWALKAIANATDINAKDYLQWTGGQPLVDASFLALGLVRCPWLWEHLDIRVRQNLVAALKSTRATVPVYSNWILFSGMIEAFFCRYGLEYDPVRIEYGIREFAGHWYVGDGLFSDGAEYHWDYYNSFVIQPYLSAIINVMAGRSKSFDWFAPRLDKITKRYAALQERMINTDGSFPVTGRSMAYRGGAFHHLADMAWRRQLPPGISAAQVRAALTAVIHKTLDAPGTFTKNGWLNIGLCGNQPGIADVYITTGSLYLCATILLPLGLPETDAFWNDPAAPWTAVKAWSGQDIPGDHALDIGK